MGWSKEDYKKFREGFTGKKEESKKKKDDYNSPEAKKARALSRAKKKAAGTW